MKKGINPKAKAILDDILGKTAADEYKAEHEKGNKEEGGEENKNWEWNKNRKPVCFL